MLGRGEKKFVQTVLGRITALAKGNLKLCRDAAGIPTRDERGKSASGGSEYGTVLLIVGKRHRTRKF